MLTTAVRSKSICYFVKLACQVFVSANTGSHFQIRRLFRQLAGSLSGIFGLGQLSEELLPVPRYVVVIRIIAEVSHLNFEQA